MTRTFSFLLVALLAAWTTCSADASSLRTATTDRKLQEIGSDVRSSKGVVYVLSQQSYEDTYAGVVSAIEANPNLEMIMAVDHAAAAAGIGEELTPSRVILVRNTGSRRNLKQKSTAFDSVQEILIFNGEGLEWVAYNIDDDATRRNLASGGGDLAYVASAATHVPVADIVAGSVISQEDKVFLNTNKPTLNNMKSGNNFEETVNGLKSAVASSPASIVVEYDVAPSATLIVVGNPNVGTPVMQASGAAAMELPLKFFIWVNQGDKTFITATNVDFLEERYGVEGADAEAALATAKGAIGNFMAAASGP